VKTGSGADQPLAKLRPADTQTAHETAWKRLQEAVAAEPHRPTVVITHHAPSRLGLNPRFAGSPLDPAYASSLDEEIAAFENVPVWVHGHTHIAKTYRVGNTVVRSNALGFVAKGGAAPGFSVKAHFDIK
jgi:Icc-related predicted phosphoesterase